MRIVGIRDSADRPYIEKFFMGYFYADYLEDPSDLREALEEYLQSTSQGDPGGRILLSQVEELLARNLTDEQLEELVEGWGPNVHASALGISYSNVLVQIRDFLRGRG